MRKTKAQNEIEQFRFISLVLAVLMVLVVFAVYTKQINLEESFVLNAFLVFMILALGHFLRYFVFEKNPYTFVIAICIILSTFLGNSFFVGGVYDKIFLLVTSPFNTHIEMNFFSNITLAIFSIMLLETLANLVKIRKYPLFFALILSTYLASDLFILGFFERFGFGKMALAGTSVIALSSVIFSVYLCVRILLNNFTQRIKLSVAVVVMALSLLMLPSLLMSGNSAQDGLHIIGLIVFLVTYVLALFYYLIESKSRRNRN